LKPKISHKYKKEVVREMLRIQSPTNGPAPADKRISPVGGAQTQDCSRPQKRAKTDKSVTNVALPAIAAKDDESEAFSPDHLATMSFEQFCDTLSEILTPGSDGLIRSLQGTDEFSKDPMNFYNHTSAANPHLHTIKIQPPKPSQEQEDLVQVVQFISHPGRVPNYFKECQFSFDEVPE
jgi:hypothetical protein